MIIQAFFLNFAYEFTATKKQDSVTKGPKFRPQSTKRAEKNFEGPGKSGAELLPDFSKKGCRGAELF
jgi:hypothetical protein